MAYRIVIAARYELVGDGVSAVMLGQSQANNPGFGAAGTPGEAGNAQTAFDLIAETVPGGDSPTAANFTTALNSAAADLSTRLSTVGLNAFTGQNGTLLAVIQGWSSGKP